MSSAGTQTLPQDLETIFRGGSFSALSDGELLACFLEGRDSTGEKAFEAIVSRHGPMVYRVCRQVVGDGHEAQDAFQAVFLVLAQRASAVRYRESLGSWLYGVALRVAARARARLRKRQTREVQAESGLNDREAKERVDLGPSYDRAEVVHHEVGRLPEKHRAPIVLCYLEGLTHDQAAARLNWPVGTVRSRLARGRDQLRGRLLRRGVTAPATLGSLAGWITAESAATAEAATAASVAISTLPAPLLSTTIRSACQFAQGRSAVALFSASSLLMAKGAVRSMTLEKLIVLACSLIPAGAITVASGVMIGQSSGPAKGPVVTTGANQEPTRVDPVAPEAITQGQDPTENHTQKARQLLRALDLKEAEAAFETEWNLLREGRVKVEALVRRASELEIFERNAGKLSSIELAERHVNRLKEIEVFLEDEIKAGRGNPLDLQFLQNALEIPQKNAQAAREFRRPTLPDLVAAARQRLDAQRAYYEEGRITIDRMISASQMLMDAERQTAKIDDDRIAAIQRHVDRLKDIEKRERAELDVGRGTVADVAEIAQRRVAAELQLKDEKASPSKAEINALIRRLDEVERKLDQLLNQKQAR